MTGLDFSPAALVEARPLAAPDRRGRRLRRGRRVLGARRRWGRGAFDLVFTGIGALIWLPDIDRWASVVAALLRPGGRLFLREGHPMLFGARRHPTRRAARRSSATYFERVEPTVYDEPGTYVATDVEFQHNLSHEWNHGIGETITALLDHGMSVTTFVEHDSVPWDALPGQMEADARGRVAADRPAPPFALLVHAGRA